MGHNGDGVNRGPRHEISDFGMGLKIGVPGRKSLIFGWGCIRGTHLRRGLGAQMSNVGQNVSLIGHFFGVPTESIFGGAKFRPHLSRIR